MLKKLLLSFLFIGFTYTAQSQVLISIIFGDKLNSPGLEFGLDGGINMSGITGLESKSYATDFHLGFYFDILLKDRWWLNTGVLVKSSQGSTKLTENDVLDLFPEYTLYADSGQFSQSFGYFNIPLMVKYRFKNHFYLELGPQIGWMTNARINYEYELDGFQLTTLTDNRDQFHRIDFGAVASFGYKLRQGKGINIGLKYYHGLVDITRYSTDIHRNQVFYFKVDIPIGKGKAERELQEKQQQQQQQQNQ